MDLTRLDKYKLQYKEFNDKINSLENLLSTFVKGGVVHTFSLDQVSEQLNLPASDAIFLLSLAEKENLLYKKYQVKTSDSDFDLGEYDSAKEIPNKIAPAGGGKPITRDNYYVEIVFKLK